MKKFNFLSFLLSLALAGFFSSCTSVKYGAHFQPSQNQQKHYQKNDRAENVQLTQEQESSAEMPEAVALPAEHPNTDASSVLASVAAVKVAPEAPKAEDITRRQAEMIKEVRERVQNMSRKEKRELRREVRKIRLADYAKDLPAYEKNEIVDIKQESDVNIIALIFAILLPPLGVFLHQGEINTKFWISLILTLLGYVPGQVYAVLVVLGVV